MLQPKRTSIQRPPRWSLSLACWKNRESRLSEGKGMAPTWHWAKWGSPTSILPGPLRLLSLQSLLFVPYCWHICLLHHKERYLFIFYILSSRHNCIKMQRVNDTQPFSWLQNFNLFLLQEKLFSTIYLKIPLYSDTSVWTSFTLEKETWKKRITDFLCKGEYHRTSNPEIVSY